MGAADLYRRTPDFNPGAGYPGGAYGHLGGYRGDPNERLEGPLGGMKRGAVDMLRDIGTGILLNSEGAAKGIGVGLATARDREDAERHYQRKMGADDYKARRDFQHRDRLDQLSSERDAAARKALEEYKVANRKPNITLETYYGEDGKERKGFFDNSAGKFLGNVGGSKNQTAPSGYKYGEGDTLTHIPGGPGDPAVLTEKHNINNKLTPDRLYNQTYQAGIRAFHPPEKAHQQALAQTQRLHPNWSPEGSASPAAPAPGEQSAVQVKPEVLAIVRDQVGSGKTIDEVRQMLVDQGYPGAVVNAYMGALNE